jgi:hypothetical protein
MEDETKMYLELTVHSSRNGSFVKPDRAGMVRLHRQLARIRLTAAAARIAPWLVPPPQNLSQLLDQTLFIEESLVDHGSPALARHGRQARRALGWFISGQGVNA